MDFLEVVNAVGKFVKRHHRSWVPAESVDASFKDLGYDSLDLLMLCIYIDELYGIPKEIGEKFAPSTIREFKEFVEAHGTALDVSTERLQSVLR